MNNIFDGMEGKIVREKTLSIKVYERLREQIQNMPSGQNKMPSEENISLSLGVSRATVREALRMLMEEGVVSKVAGVGIFAHPSVTMHRNRIDLNPNFFKLLEQNHGEIKLNIHQCKLNAPSERFLKHFPDNGDKQIYMMHWTYVVDGENLIHSVFELPVDVFKEMPSNNIEVNSLPEFSQKYLYAPISYCAMYVKSGFDAKIAKIFDVPENTPMQVWEELLYDRDDKKIGFCVLQFHPTKLELTILNSFE